MYSNRSAVTLLPHFGNIVTTSRLHYYRAMVTSFQQRGNRKHSFKYMEQFKYFAFISYSTHDTKWGKRIHKKLESYSMPATLCSKHGWKRKPLNPIFFAPYDIQPGGLTEELKNRLRQSRNLIVICSPNSAQSYYVGLEIEFFHQLGRTKNIHFFIIDGEPNSGDKSAECFNPKVKQLGIPEILGANIHEKVYRWPWLNRERAYVQIVTKLLGVEFDSIWQRHRRMLRQRIALWFIGMAAVLAALIGTWLTNRPVDVEVSLKETSVHNKNLPPLHNAVVTLMLDNEKKTDTLNTLSCTATFTNIPASMIGKEVRVQFRCEDWCTTDTTLLLSKNIALSISRDINAFGHVRFTMYDSQVMPVAGKTIRIAGVEAKSNAQGVVDAIIPIEKQNTVYNLTSSEVSLVDTIKDAKCGDSDAVFTK